MTYQDICKKLHEIKAGIVKLKLEGVLPSGEEILLSRIEGDIDEALKCCAPLIREVPGNIDAK